MDEPTCFICGRGLFVEKTTTVKERGIQTLVQQSRANKDGKHLHLKNCSSVEVHESCRTRYTKYVMPSTSQAGEKRSRQQEEAAFDFKANCVICGEKADDEFKKKQMKKPVSYRDSVHFVETLPFKNSLITAAQKRGAIEVIDRINLVHDLVAAEARYHKSCGKNFFSKSGSQSRGRPHAESVSICVDYICEYMENSDDSQIKLSEILQDFEGENPSEKAIVARLQQKYGDDVIVNTHPRHGTIICFRDTGYRILTQEWYSQQKSDPEQERLRIVEAAAAIIREDIRSTIYDTDTYPNLESFLEHVDEDVPKTLKVLLQKIMMPRHSKQYESVNRKVIAASHAVISCARPRTFVSALQVGLGAMLMKKYGSQKLVDLLSSLGLCCSYYEARKFEASCIFNPPQLKLVDSFLQFVFDNTDVNIDTLDGLNTFHAMAGILCSTPYHSVQSEGRLPRLAQMPMAPAIRETDKIELVPYQKPANSEGLKKVIVENVDHEPVAIRSEDFVWLYGKWRGQSNVPGWNGFMENLYHGQPFELSRVVFLPFLNSPPGNHDTIYSVLIAAVEKCKNNKQKCCFVTFDQPLYYKARDIVASCESTSPLASVIVRLGGFHTVMSFMGAIGFIMSGSGLQELFKTVYAAGSTEKMLTGHAYSRAVRAHFLAHLALAKCVLSMLKINDKENSHMLEALEHIGKPTFNIPQDRIITTVLKKFSDKLVELESYSPTAKLWVLYFRMVTILKEFIHAERSGDWHGHLQSLRQMVPLFHASGHFLYAKSSQLYLQDMANLKDRLNSDEYNRYVEQGYFTVRRSDKFWSGIWTDQTIEQTTNRAMKVQGGVKSGRGITDSVLVRWVASMPSILEVSSQIENYCGIEFATTEQHVDARVSRVQKDDSDVQTFEEWFSTHNPFPVGGQLMSLSTGVIGDDSINCHEAYEIGAKSIENVVGSNFKQIKFQRKNRVLPLRCVNSNVRIHDEIVPVHPETIFRRISLFKKSDEDLKVYFQYELAPYPLSLFDESGMRKTRKSVFYDLFEPVTEVNEGLEMANPVYVIDGGFLLHRVVWQAKETYSAILQKYVDFVKRHYNVPGSIIVFDGYPDDASMRSTKTAERLRRKNKISAATVAFDESMTATMSKEAFLSNENNKQRLISMLRGKLEGEGFVVKVAHEDADTLIVNSAVELDSSSPCVMIVGEDTDLLILLTALAPTSTTISLMKPGKGTGDDTLYAPCKFKHSEAVKDNILFLHAFSGCDTTSAFFRHGKKKLVRLMEKQDSLHPAAEVFKDGNATSLQIGSAGEKFHLALYGAKDDESIDETRYSHFVRTITKPSTNLASLPPTKDAAYLHSLRTYYQVQSWLGTQKEPTDYGWKVTPQGLLPISMTKPAAPSEVLNKVSCKCEKGCKHGCSCRKAGLKCSYVCLHCKGQSCPNAPLDEPLAIINDEEETPDDPDIVDEE